MLADRLQLRPAQMISLGLSLELVGSLILLGDIRYQHAGMALAAVALIIGGQVVLRPHAAVLLGLLYPRNDRRLETAFTAFYLSVNLGSLVGPLIGGAMFRQYGWNGAIGTLAGTAALALYGFSVSQTAFSRLSFPLRGVHADASGSRHRFLQVVLLLGLTLLCFWVAFYALSDKFHAFFAATVGSGTAQPNLQSANLFIQGLSSESVTPLFVAFMAPVLLAAMRFSIKSNKSQRMVAKVAGGLLICALALVVSSVTPMAGLQIYGYYIALSAAELLVVPTVMALTSSISNQQTLFSLMSGNYLVAGIGILLADHGIGSSGSMLWALAALSAVIAALWLFRRKSWESLLPRPS
jgi:dipeptide/tripeptide permease